MQWQPRMQTNDTDGSAAAPIVDPKGRGQWQTHDV